MIDGIRADLERFVAVPSVGADPARAADLRRSAERVAEAFGEVGVPCTVEQAAGGGPAVIGRRPGPPGAPTVLLYAHHDVQPVDGDWASDPFVLTERAGRWFGRGTADDKGGIAVHLAALRGLEPLPVSVAVLVEGEEETGSPTLEALLAEHGDRVRADVALAPDSLNAGPLAPTLTVSLRGLLSVLVTVRTADRALHSGVFGGAVPDALGALVRVLDTLLDADGRPAVEGLQLGRPSGTAGPTAAELGAALRPGVRLLGTDVTDGPAITVTGLDAPPAGGAPNVLVPEARAAVSVRLAPEQDPAEAAAALDAHLRRSVPFGAEIDVRTVAAGRGWRVRSSAVGGLAAEALAESFGAPVTEVGVGGGIPFVAALTAAFPETDVLVTAVQDPDSRAHAPDESVDPRALVAAARAEREILRGAAWSGLAGNDGGAPAQRISPAPT